MNESSIQAAAAGAAVYLLLSMMPAGASYLPNLDGGIVIRMDMPQYKPIHIDGAVLTKMSIGGTEWS